MKAMAVTGFVPNAFPAKHYTPGQAEALGERLKTALAGRICAFDPWKLEDCWAMKLVSPTTTASCSSPPTDRFVDPKHMVLSNAVLLQRYAWMAMAAVKHPDVDVFAWVEYTALKQRNVTEQVLINFVDTLEKKNFDAISLPGCWPKGPINDSDAHWRFCGSCVVCPSKYTGKLFSAISTVVALRTSMTDKLSWDMNTMAYVELLDVLPIRWYQADHGDTQFTNF